MCIYTYLPPPLMARKLEGEAKDIVDFDGVFLKKRGGGILQKNLPPATTIHHNSTSLSLLSFFPPSHFPFSFHLPLVFLFSGLSPRISTNNPHSPFLAKFYFRVQLSSGKNRVQKYWGKQHNSACLPLSLLVPLSFVYKTPFFGSW